MSEPFTPSLGAHLTRGGVRFRTWAPDRERVALELTGQGGGSPTVLPMARIPDGVWEAVVPDARPGTRYRFQLDDEGAFPDPWSLSQPDGVHGPSEVVDLAAFDWHDGAWRGRPLEGTAIYECHVGTVTPEGTFESLIADLDRLRSLGITAVELMPVAEFPGGRNWGYDGAYLFAPTRAYGGPTGLQRLVDAAHQRGLAVILDVVYNHLGPDGNYLRLYAKDYFTDRYQTPWGEAINYDGPNSYYPRRLAAESAAHWVAAYHLDGLRLDATDQIHDSSSRHLLREISETVRGTVKGERSVLLIAETVQNDPRHFQPAEQGGYGLDAVWADDFHHTLRRFLTGEHGGYYDDYQGTLDEVARTIDQGWLYTGQVSAHLGEPRGKPLGAGAPAHLVYAIQNHDQVGNRALGDRLHHAVDLERYRAASALLLFLPTTPLLFMGQEFVTSAPFQYFTDHNSELGRLVTEGRRREFGHMRAFGSLKPEDVPDPQAAETYRASRLPTAREAPRGPGAATVRLYTELLRLRREDPVLAVQAPAGESVHAEALGPDVLVVRRATSRGTRLLAVDFGDETRQVPLPAEGTTWRVLLSTSEPRFGGEGAAEPRIHEGTLLLPPRTAAILAADRDGIGG